MIDKQLDQWTEHEIVSKGRQKSGVKRYRQSMELFISWFEGNGKSFDAGAVSRSDIDAFMKWLFYEKSNVKNSTRAAKLSALRSFFKYMIYIGAITADPTENVPTPKITAILPSKFTTEELRFIFAAPDLSKQAGIRDKAMLTTIYGAGLRVSEVCNLNISHIIDTGGYIRLNILNSKHNKSRTLTLRTNPSRFLRYWLTIRMANGAKHDDKIFTALKGNTKWQRLSSVSVNNVLKKYAVRVGINSSDAFVHKLRATFATDLYDFGVGILEVMYLLGHSDPKTTMRYIAISDKVLKKTAIPDVRWKDLLKGDAAH